MPHPSLREEWGTDTAEPVIPHRVRPPPFPPERTGHPHWGKVLKRGNVGGESRSEPLGGGSADSDPGYYFQDVAGKPPSRVIHTLYDQFFP